MRYFAAIALLIALVLFSQAPAHAEWLPDGALVSGTDVVSGELMIAAADSGGWYVAWRSLANPPASTDKNIRVQRVLEDGSLAPGWPTNGVLVCEGTGYRWLEGLVADGAGGVVIGWNDSRDWPDPNGWDIYLQRILPDGSIAPGWPVNGLPAVATTSSEWLYDVAVATNGDILLAWHTGTGAPGYNVYVHGHNNLLRLDGDGLPAPGWPAGGHAYSPPSYTTGPWIASDGAGGWFVVWPDTFEVNRNRSLAIHVDSLGVPFPEFAAGAKLVASYGAAVDAIPDGSGGALLPLADWRLRPSGAYEFLYQDVYAQHIGPDGEPLPGWPLEAKPVCTERSLQQDIHIVPDGAGGAYLAWEDNRTDGTTASDIYVQRITGAGDPAPGWPVAGLRVALSTQPEWEPQIVADGVGGVYVSWVEYVPPYRVRAQHLLGNGQIHPDWPLGGRFITSMSSGGAQLAPASPGNAFIAFGSDRSGTPAVYCFLLSDDDITAVQVSLAHVEATPDLVRLEWHASGDPIGIATVERRSESSEWRALGSVTADGTGRIVFEDRDVTPGDRFAYRLAYLDEGLPATTPAAWVDVPAGHQLGLAGFRPNPLSSGAWSVEFSLAQRGPGLLEVFDVSGRRTAQRDLSQFEAGRHLIQLEAGASQPSGVYWVRLAHSGKRLAARGAVAR